MEVVMGILCYQGPNLADAHMDMYRGARAGGVLSTLAHRFGGSVTFTMVSPEVALDRKVCSESIQMWH